ncbi:hypothetical protein Gotur_001910 [Gossypium turneri]
MNITGMSEQWVVARIKQKGDSRCIPWKNLKDIILAYLDTKKKVDAFALSIYGLVVFPKALGHVDEAVTDLFDRLDKRVTPVSVILVETFRSRNTCRRVGEGRFIGCAQLLFAWFHSHFWKFDKVSYRVFSENYSPLKEIVATPRRDDILEEKWVATFQNLQEEDVEWRASWLLLDEILQYRLRQFIPATRGLAECEFSYKCDGCKKKIREISNAWNQTHRIKRLAVELEKKDRANGRREDELRLDIDVQELEAEKLSKGKNKADKDLDSLKLYYKKLCLSTRTAGLGKTSEQWCEEIQEEKNKADRASLSKIEEMKERIEELESALQNCRIEYLKTNEDRQNEQLHHLQNQVRNRDHIMGEAVVQIRGVADHLQTLAVQVDTLSVKYELESNWGHELALSLRKIRVLSIRAKPYL